ncbi:uncharacterized protein [Clytia hemisphaerica]|uniref:Ephrin RBD domain-containing protein n=1 Tax=Clytia hemisphaerica TaxID=252671 RepID=A0A7M5XIN1_9CNID
MLTTVVKLNYLLFIASQLICFALGNLYLPTILWDSRNFLFGCEDLTIYVKNTDSIMFACPSKFLYSRREGQIVDSVTFEAMYGVEENDVEKFNTCNATGLTPFHTCDYENKATLPFYSISISKLSQPFSFDDKAKTVYIFSTSFQTRDMLSNKINGSCAPQSGYFPLKLKIHKCADNDKECEAKICDTMECFVKDCGMFTAWQKEDTFLWNGTCLQKETRQCVQPGFPCHEETERLVPADEVNCTNYREECPTISTSSISPTPSSITKDASSISQSECQQCSPCPSTSYTQPNASQELSVTTVTETMNQTIVSTVVNPEASISVSVRISTLTVAETVRVTETASCNNLCTQTPGNPTGSQKEYITHDVPYDDKFYITVISGIIGAMLVGVFVLHACLVYRKGNKIKQHKVIEVKEYKSETKVTSTEHTSTSGPTNGKYTRLEEGANPNA